MAIRNIYIKDILIDDSIFAPGNFVFESGPEPTCHINSFETLGILYPVIVYQDDKKRFHLIDGKKRVLYSKEFKADTISAIVLPAPTPFTDIIPLLLCGNRTAILSSTMSKVRFICFALSLNIPEKWLLQTVCLPFELKPQSAFLQECLRINNLPHDISLFCHEKKFSLKQLINLSYQPVELLKKIIHWKSSIQLTASILDELTANLKDYLKLHNKDLDEFIEGSGINDILESSLSPRDKTEEIRRIIRIKRFPLLSEANDKITETVNALELPNDISFNWDRTLENRNIDIKINIKDPEKLKELLDTLKTKKIKDAIKKVLDEL